MGPPGHLSSALAAKPAAPKAPLWVLLVATEVLDLLSFALFGLGIERAGVGTTDLSRGVQVLRPASVPWSHGLLMSVVRSLVLAAIAFLFFRDRRSSAVFGLLVFSHWVLDFVVHLSDLPLLFEGSSLVGLGTWPDPLRGPGARLAGWRAGHLSDLAETRSGNRNVRGAVEDPRGSGTQPLDGSQADDHCCLS